MLTHYEPLIVVYEILKINPLKRIFVVKDENGEEIKIKASSNLDVKATKEKKWLLVKFSTWGLANMSVINSDNNPWQDNQYKPLPSFKTEEANNQWRYVLPLITIS